MKGIFHFPSSGKNLGNQWWKSKRSSTTWKTWSVWLPCRSALQQPPLRCLTRCVRYSSFTLIPQSKRREKYLATTCCGPTNKKKVSPWNVLWEDGPMAEDFYFNLLQDSKAKYFLLHLVSWINDHQRLLKEHESVVSLEGTRHIQSRNEGKLSF